MGRLVEGGFAVTWLGVFAIVALSAAAQALSGFGFALIAVPVVALLVGPKAAVVGLTMVGIVLVSWMAIRTKGNVNARVVGLFLVFGLTGMPFGLLVLRRTDERLLTAIIAVVVIAFTVMLWRGIRFPAGRVTDAIAGFAGGFLTASTATSGPPFVIALANKGIPPNDFRRTLASLFLVQGSAAVVLFSVSGQVTADALRVALAALPGLILGRVAGERAFSHVDPEGFRRIVLAMLLLSGLVSLGGAAVS